MLLNEHCPLYSVNTPREAGRHLVRTPNRNLAHFCFREFGLTLLMPREHCFPRPGCSAELRVTTASAEQGVQVPKHEIKNSLFN